MKIVSEILDKKINTLNYLLEMSNEEYLSFARDITNNNQYQRKRVKSSVSIYSQLKQDMKQGCIFPPIVLAIDNSNEVKKFRDDMLENLKNSMILDGLQRTYTLLDAAEELEKSEPESWKRFLQFPIRVEVYADINRFGILYRMLTLNTGQTPMSLRHQIEILYNNYEISIPSVKLIKEVDGITPINLGEYKFQDMIEGFMSYLQSSFLPMNRSTILETIKTLDTVSSEDIRKDLFQTFVECFHNLTLRLDYLTPSDEIDEYIENLSENDKYSISGADTASNYLFTKSILSLVTKSQVITGFGAALAYLKEAGVIYSIEEIQSKIKNIVAGGAYKVEWFEDLNDNLYTIKQRSSKIGNSQRLYFYYFFRSLFSNGSDSYLNLERSQKSAMQKYLIEIG